jgi:hypothetical protein
MEGEKHFNIPLGDAEGTVVEMGKQGNGLENIEKNKKEYNREHNADLFLKFSSIAENIDAFDGRKMEEVFSNEENRRDFLEKLDSEDFIELISGFNGIMRSKEKKDWEMDGENVALVAHQIEDDPGLLYKMFGDAGVEEYYPPEFSDKKNLLTEALSAAKEMNKNDESLEDIALMMSSVLNAVHPFGDGNGRTSRIIFKLLTEGFNENNRQGFKEILSDKGRENIDINPGLVEFEILKNMRKEAGMFNEKTRHVDIIDLDMDDYFKKKIDAKGIRDTKLFNIGNKEINIPKEIDDEKVKELAEIIKKDQKYIEIGMTEFIKKHPEINNKEFTASFGPRSRVDFEYFVQHLDNEKIQEVINDYYKTKKGYVEKLINGLAYPDREENRLEDGKSLRDVFKEKITREKEEANMEKERIEEKKREKEELEKNENIIIEKFKLDLGERNNVPKENILAWQEIQKNINKTIEEADLNKENKEKWFDNLPPEEKNIVLNDAMAEYAKHIDKENDFIKDYLQEYLENSNKFLEWSGVYSEILKFSKIMEYLEGSRNFEYKINTSSLFERKWIDKDLSPIERREQVSSVFDDLLTQSVYYIDNGKSSLRLKLYNVINNGKDGVIQPVAEKILFGDAKQVSPDVTVIKALEEPQKYYSIFEVSSKEFNDNINVDNTEVKNVENGIQTLDYKDNTYINLKDTKFYHMGRTVSQVEKFETKHGN